MFIVGVHGPGGVCVEVASLLTQFGNGLSHSLSATTMLRGHKLSNDLRKSEHGGSEFVRMELVDSEIN
jgi:hypothetical protein